MLAQSAIIEGMALWVWSEFLTPDELCQPRVVELLARHGCGVLVQARPDGLGEPLATALRTLRDGGVPETGLWLLLDETAGYWPSERNAAIVLDLARRVVDWQPAASWLAIDLEPPLWQARHSRLKAARANLSPTRFAAATEVFQKVIDTAHAGGLHVLCAAHDYLVEDLWLGRPVLQDLHEAPVLGLSWDAISVMLYGSMLQAPRRWLYDVASALRSQGIGASIGLTGVGVLGDEPYYTLPEELARDAGALKAAGVTDFAVYSLEGILASNRPDAWLQAVIDAQPEVPRPSAWVRRERARRRARGLIAAAYRAVKR
jgi:hypothetical protein